MARYVKSPDREWLKKRLMGAGICIIAVFAVLLMRLIYLQIIKGEEYRRLSENNCIRLKSIKASRGLIYDRNGKLLVDNRPSFNLKIVTEDTGSVKSTVEKVSRLIDVPKKSLLSGIEKNGTRAFYKPVVLKNNISRDQVAIIEAHKFDLPGIIIDVEPRRHYIYERSCAHLLGYLGEINKKELQSGRHPDVYSGDSIGRYGVEKKFEKLLHGKRGGRQVEVDADGRIIKVLDTVDPEPGMNLSLTVDLELQQVAESMLENKSGAVVAVDPSNGEVLAMASYPAFDQNDFIGGISGKKWRKLMDDPNKPMTNKAIQGEYPPASTYKIVSTIAALEEDIVDKNTQFFCPGHYRYGNRTYRCWKKWGHGDVDIIKAIERSCDVFFYHVGEKAGVDVLAEYAKGCGLGRKTGIVLDDERSGLVPTTDWKENRFGVPWQGGENLSIAIGQGYNLVTPLQMAMLASAVGNGGVLYKPRVLKHVTDGRDKVVKKGDPEINGGIPAGERTMEVLKKGLLKVVQGSRGTARGIQIKGAPIAGKTGTAQVFSIKDREILDTENLDYFLKDHAWFVCYAPAKDPVIAVSVLVEHGEHGSSTAAPIAKAVVKKCLEKRNLLKAEDE
ncbi:MAG: penicillin-binding protein 2 [Desulfobacteraceae bacterium]